MQRQGRETAQGLNIYCSFRGPRFGFQNPHLTITQAHNHPYLQFQGNPIPFSGSLDTRHTWGAHAYMRQKHTLKEQYILMLCNYFVKRLAYVSVKKIKRNSRRQRRYAVKFQIKLQFCIELLSDVPPKPHSPSWNLFEFCFGVCCCCFVSFFSSLTVN